MRLKRLAAAIISAAMAFSMGGVLPAHAAEQGGSTQVTAVVAADYTLIIPASITLTNSVNGQTGSGTYTKTFDVRVKGDIGENQKVTVTATPPTMTCGGESVAAGFAEGYKSEWSYSEVAGEGTAGSYTVSAAGLTPGTWTGTANFGCELETSGTSTITFTLRGVQYQANAGMTWGEWIVSEYNSDGAVYVCGETGVHVAGKECDVQDSDCNYVSTSDVIKDGEIYGAPEVCQNAFVFWIAEGSSRAELRAIKGMTWEYWLNQFGGTEMLAECGYAYEKSFEEFEAVILTGSEGLWVLSTDHVSCELKSDRIIPDAVYFLQEFEG